MTPTEMTSMEKMAAAIGAPKMPAKAALIPVMIMIFLSFSLNLNALAMALPMLAPI